MVFESCFVFFYLFFANKGTIQSDANSANTTYVPRDKPLYASQAGTTKLRHASRLVRVPRLMILRAFTKKTQSSLLQHINTVTNTQTELSAHRESNNTFTNRSSFLNLISVSPPLGGPHNVLPVRSRPAIRGGISQRWTMASIRSSVQRSPAIAIREQCAHERYAGTPR